LKVDASTFFVLSHLLQIVLAKAVSQPFNPSYKWAGNELNLADIGVTKQALRQVDRMIKCMAAY
jgi:hypothetical protein